MHNRFMLLLDRRDNCWTYQVKTIRLLDEVIIVKNLFELRLRPLIIFLSNLFFWLIVTLRNLMFLFLMMIASKFSRMFFRVLVFESARTHRSAISSHGNVFIVVFFGRILPKFWISQRFDLLSRRLFLRFSVVIS